MTQRDLRRRRIPGVWRCTQQEENDVAEADDIPEGYTYAQSSSAFINHVGRVFHKVVEKPGGETEYWRALRVEPHQVNTWNFAHGGLMAALAEMVSGAPAYIPGGQPAIVVDMSIQFMKAPKLGDLLEARGTAVRRTKSMVFTYAQAFVGKDIMFTVSAVHKIIGS
jgi:uncharacterized protein (TIGR00369 family)